MTLRCPECGAENSAIGWTSAVVEEKRQLEEVHPDGTTDSEHVEFGEYVRQDPVELWSCERCEFRTKDPADFVPKGPSA